MGGVGLVVVVGVVCVLQGRSEAAGCALTAPHILEEEQALSEGVNIIEYDLLFNGYSSEFWSEATGPYWYNPTRFYKCSSSTAERFLLLFHYYYGMFKPLVNLGLKTQKVDVTTEPLNCLRRMSEVEIETLVKLFILNNMSPADNTSTPTASDTSVCSMRIIDDNGWGKQGYKCCRMSSAGHVTCYLVADDIWIWVLRSLIIIASVVLFLYFPLLIPKGYKLDVFSYFPETPKFVNIMTTRNPDFKVLTQKTLLVTFKKCLAMTKFRTMLSEIPTDVVHTFQVKKVDFQVGFDRILAENEPPFGILRALFDSLIRFKIRHSDPLEDCCTSRVCGQCSCRACPEWQVLLRALRTILIFALLALPAVPRLYYFCSPQLHYREVNKIMADLGLKQTYNYDINITAGTVVVAVLSAVYVLHVAVVVIDGILDRNLGKLYGELLYSNAARSSVAYNTSRIQSAVRTFVLPVKKFGIIIVPLWLVCLIISPVILLLYFIVTSPVFRIAIRVLRLLLGTCQSKRNRQEETGGRTLENLAFSTTIFAVFIVLTVGFNFLLHVCTMVIIDMVININLTMRILPVILLLIFYIRDTFSKVSSTYLSYHNTILGLMMSGKMQAVRDVAKKNIQDQENIVFEVCTQEEVHRYLGPLFSLKDGTLRMNTRGLVLFLHKDDTPYLSKKFFHLTTGINCHGGPGNVSWSVIKAIFEFCRVIVFLACLLVIVMAYGDISYISPEGQFFATFVTGLIPFALKKFFLKNDSSSRLDVENLRFTTQLDEMKNFFRQSWKIDDIIPVTDADRARPTVVPPAGNGVSTSTWNIGAVGSKSQTATHKDIDIIVDLTGVNTTEICGFEEDEADLKEDENTCGAISCVRSASVSP